MAKTWQQKLEEKKGEEPKILVLQKPRMGAPAGGRLLMPTPALVKTFMDTIPKGQPISVQAMREQIAQRHHSDVACPLSTSSSARVVAEAAWEEIQAGIATDRVTPFWRAIEPDSALAQKLTCGATFLQTMRESEAV